MKPYRVGLHSLLLGAAMVLVACTEGSPTAPAPAPVSAPTAVGPTASGDLLGIIAELTKKLGLLKCTPVASASASKVIGPSGGTLVVGQNKLTVPAGALTSNVTITGVAPSDNVNHIRFTPEGLQFKKSATLEMGYGNCNLFGILIPKHIAYTDDELRIKDLLQSIDNLLSKKITTDLKHFSEYAVAW